MRIFLPIIVCCAAFILTPTATLAQVSHQNPEARSAETVSRFGRENGGDGQQQQLLRAKAFELTEQIAAAADDLKLAENRAYLLVSAGNLLWLKDSQRAQALFRRAANESVLVQYAEDEDRDEDQANSDEDIKSGYLSMLLLEYEPPRRKIFSMMAERDPALALELLIQTRRPLVRAAIEQLMNESAEEAAPHRELDVSNLQLTPNIRVMLREAALEDLKLEHAFRILIAEANPALAAQRIRANNLRGGAPENLKLIKRVFATDAALGRRLLAETVQAAIENDFSSPDSAALAARVIREFAQPAATKAAASSSESILTIDAQLLRRLSGKVIDKIFRDQSANAFINDQSLVAGTGDPLLREDPGETAPFLLSLMKTAPERSAAVAKIVTGQSSAFSQPEQQTAWSSGALETDSRSPPDEALKALDQAVKEGRYEEAAQLSGALQTKSARIRQRIKLSLLAAARKDERESCQLALKLLASARAEAAAAPISNSTDFANFLQLSAAYAVVAPAQAFALLEPLLDQTDELLRASALLDRYHHLGFSSSRLPLKSGELLLAVASRRMGEPYSFAGEINLLAEEDFGRLVSLADRFERADARLLARLEIARSLLAEAPAGS